MMASEHDEVVDRGGRAHSGSRGKVSRYEYMANSIVLRAEGKSLCSGGESMFVHAKASVSSRS